VDGYRSKGKSGILRYDFNYRYRAVLIPLCLILFSFSLWLIYKNRDEQFIENGIWLGPLLPIYFLLKLTGKFTPLVKMLVISIIVSAVVVSLYSSENIFSDFFGYERLIMMLLGMLNQLVLEHFEYHEEHKALHPASEDMYESIAKRIFIWMTLVLVIVLVLNPFAWMIVLSLFITSLFLRLIIAYQDAFKSNRLYRYWADFSFILMWPLLKLFTVLNSLF